MPQTSNDPEIILKDGQVQEWVGNLPEGPFGEEMLVSKERMVLISRNVTSEEPSAKAELHENYTDIFLVKEGSEEFFIGGEIADKQQYMIDGKPQPGEWRGTEVNSVPGNEIRKYQIEANDIVIIPKGIIHRHGAGTIKMLVIKVS